MMPSGTAMIAVHTISQMLPTMPALKPVPPGSRTEL